MSQDLLAPPPPGSIRLSRRPPSLPVETSGGKMLLAELLDLLEENARCVLLIGQGGPEKTLVLQELASTLDSTPRTGHLIYFDVGKQFELLLNQSSLTASLLGVVTESVVHYLERNGKAFQSFVDDTFSNDLFLQLKRQLNPQAKASEKATLLDQERRIDPDGFLKSCLRFLVRNVAPGKVILVLDNLDSFSSDLQLRAIELAHAAAQGLGIFSLVSIHGTTARLLSRKRPELMKSIQQIEASLPRVRQILKYLLAVTPEKVGGQGLTQQLLDQLVDVLAQCFSEEAEELLGGLSNGRLQDAASLILQALQSPHLSSALPTLAPDRRSVLAAAAKPTYFQFLKALMLGTDEFYRSEVSPVGNAFGAASTVAYLRPFLRIYIVLLTQKYQDVGLSESEVCEVLGKVLEADHHEVRQEVAWLVGKEWLERVEVNLLVVTRRGSCFVDQLIRRPEYQSQVALGMEITQATGRPLSKPVREPIDEARNLFAFLEYLAGCERSLFRQISRDGLRDYQESFGDRGLTHDMISKAIEFLADQKDDDSEVKSTLREIRNSLEIFQSEGDIPSFIRDFGGR